MSKVCISLIRPMEKEAQRTFSTYESKETKWLLLRHQVERRINVLV